LAERTIVGTYRITEWRASSSEKSGSSSGDGALLAVPILQAVPCRNHMLGCLDA
jgi:hypothetical protein